MLANSPVLVLNKVWHPIAVISLERAMAKLCNCYKSGEPKAKIIEVKEFIAYSWQDWSKLVPEENDSVIRTRFEVFKLPEVILLTRYDKIPENKVHFNRRAIFHRDGNICAYCGKKLNRNNQTIDHITARSRGGATNWSNCISCCTDCNRKKGDCTPEEAGMKLLRQPIKPKYNLYSIDKNLIPKSWGQFLTDLLVDNI